MANAQLIYGVHPVLEALQSGAALDKILLKRGIQAPWVKELRGLCFKFEIPLQEVPQEKLDRVYRGNHQGVLGFRSLIDYVDISVLIPTLYEQGENPLVVVLDRVSDVRNFGAITRSAHALGAHAVVVPSRGMAQINEDAIKSSAGALNHIPVCKSWNLKETLMYLKEAGLQLVGATEKAEGQVWETDLCVPTALVMGSEEDGISPAYLAMLDQCVAIPQSGKVGSLNVGAATAICLYEITRQRNGSQDMGIAR